MDFKLYELRPEIIEDIRAFNMNKFEELGKMLGVSKQTIYHKFYPRINKPRHKIVLDINLLNALQVVMDKTLNELIQEKK
jgi:hypothetical protein